MPGSERTDSNAPFVRLELSDADRAILKKKAARGLVRALGAQAIMAALATVIAWVVAGWAAGASAFIGAAAYFVPNALFALRLLVGLVGSKKASPLAFFFGELFKLGSAVLLLALAAYVGQGWLVWPAVLFGLVCVLKGYVLLLVLGRLP